MVNKPLAMDVEQYNHYLKMKNDVCSKNNENKEQISEYNELIHFVEASIMQFDFPFKADYDVAQKHAIDFRDNFEHLRENLLKDTQSLYCELE
jgi:hypothetical protein